MTDEKRDAILAQLVECVEAFAERDSQRVKRHRIEARRLLDEGLKEPPPLKPPFSFLKLPDR